jgi:hypothetical protein
MRTGGSLCRGRRRHRAAPTRTIPPFAPFSTYAAGVARTRRTGHPKLQGRKAAELREEREALRYTNVGPAARRSRQRFAGARKRGKERAGQSEDRPLQRQGQRRRPPPLATAAKDGAPVKTKADSSHGSPQVRATRFGMTGKKGLVGVGGGYLRARFVNADAVSWGWWSWRRGGRW